MGFIMPLYTIGIVSFFIYTILKLIFKKTPATPYPEIKPDTTFRNEVFTAPDQPYIKRPDSGTTKLVNYTSPSGSSGNNSNSSASALIQSRTADGATAVASDGSEQLMELDLLRRKLDETEQAMTKIIANMGAIPKGQSSRLFKVW